MNTLGIDPELLNTCVGCGLCLPHCPTYRVSGEERLSPRGRIDAMRGVVDRNSAVDTAFGEMMDTCVQCRGCEPACPSGVQYGVLIGQTRTALASGGRKAPLALRLGLAALSHPYVLRVGTLSMEIVGRIGFMPRRLRPARVALRRGPRVQPTATADPDVWLFTGCVMDVWFRSVHRSTARVLDGLGVTYNLPDRRGNCCGALHEHAGMHARAQAYAHSVMASMPGDAPVLVNSAGCGAHLKDLGHLLDTDEGRRFAARVFDIHEWIAPRLGSLSLDHLNRSVIVQDPCHLRHVQRADTAVHTVLERVVTVVTLGDDGVCCGAGGAYSVAQPELSARIRDRKLKAIERARGRHPSATTIASANPGCAMYLQAGLDADHTVVHPIELLAEALR